MYLQNHLELQYILYYENQLSNVNNIDRQISLHHIN